MNQESAKHQKSLTVNDIEKKIGVFVKEVFVQDVLINKESASCSLEVDKKDWLMNDHFPGTCLIQCFFQAAMLLYYENNELFDPKKELFFLGDLKVKYRSPVLLNDVVDFRVNCTTYTYGILLFSGEGVLKNGKKLCVKLSGSLASKPRSSISK